MAIELKKEYKKYRKYYQDIEPVLAKPKNRAYTTAIFSFLAVSLFGWYGIRPTLQTILTLRREIEDNTIVNKKMEDKISNLIQIQATYQSIQTQLPLLDEAVPTDPTVIPLIAQLQRLANDVQASVSAVQVPTTPLLSTDASRSATLDKARAAASPALAEIPLTVAVVGDYASLTNFVSKVITLRRIVTIQSISMLPARDAENSINSLGPTLRLVMRVQAYYAKKP